MPDEDLTFRPAADEDWPAIYPIFSAVTETGETYPYGAGLDADQAREIWMAPEHAVFVALLGNEVVGTAYLKPNMTGRGDHVCNAGWMVDPSRQGQGIGRPFAGYVIEEARSAGFRGMQFNAVVATNEGAIALWESLGFEVVGTVPGAFRHEHLGYVPIHIMYRGL